MGPHTSIGLISYAALMASSTVTGFSAMKMTLDRRKGRVGDHKALGTVATFATMTLLAAMVFWSAEAR